MILGAMLLAGMVNAADPAGTVNWNEQNVWKSTKIKAGTDGAALEATTPCLVESSVLIPVHEKAEYRFSGEVRKAKGAPSALFLAGFILYDKDKKTIQPQHVRVIRGTDTVLAEEAKAGDHFIKIRNGARWTAKTYHYAAFNAVQLPNRDLSPDVISAVKREGQTWTVSFGKPLQKSYPAGTKVRMHRAGSGWTYCAAANKPLSVEWTTFTGKIKGSGFHRKGGEFYDRFRPGTRLVVPALTLRNTGKEPVKVFFRNLKLEEMK
mgnify:CR=1 FL=1